MGRLNPSIQTMSQRLGFRDTDLTQSVHDQILFWLQKEVVNCLSEIFPLPKWTGVQIADCRARAKRLVNCEIERLERAATSKQKRIKEYANNSPLNSKWVEEAKTEHETLRAAIDRLSALPDLPEPPEPQIKLVQTPTVEHPIDNGNERNKVIVGFADLLAVCETPKNLDIDGYYDSETRFRDPRWHIQPERRAVLFEVKTQMPTFGELMRQLRTYGKYFGGSIAVVAPDDRFAQQLREQGIHFFKYPLELPRDTPTQTRLL